MTECYPSNNASSIAAIYIFSTSSSDVLIEMGQSQLMYSCSSGFMSLLWKLVTRSECHTSGMGYDW